MEYFICVLHSSTGNFSTLWGVEGNTAIRIGISNARSQVHCYCEARDGESIFDSIRRVFENWNVIGEIPIYRTHLNPGEYYHRIARPNDQHYTESPGSNPGKIYHEDFIANALGQLNVLVRQLENICQTVHPSTKTFETYGHAIRNFLIIACTEVEMHCKGILKSNGVIKSNYNTGDYFKLCKAMRLNEFSVRLPKFPWLDPISPFLNWCAPNTTASLPWYDAYNAVKHDRENQFERATLANAFSAASACYILLVAQFGTYFEELQSSESLRFFVFDRLPSWTPSDVYTYPYDAPVELPHNEAWIPKDYNFDV